MIRRILLLVLITLPTTTYANIEITEIMYDLEGSDTKREWVEIVNNGADSVDLTDWRFYDGSNHVLNPPPENGGQGSLVISPGAYAILVSDATTFVSEYGVSGTIIDTVMSLSNTGEIVSLINGEGVVVDEVMYTSELGGSGNGNSLQIFQGIWKESAPTLFESSTVPNVIDTPDGGQNEDTQAPLDEKVSQEEVKSTASLSSFVGSQIHADAGEDGFGVVSSLFFFEGHAYGIKNESLKNARFVWNFGDGSFEEGQNVAHTYVYPGTYRTSLTISSGEFSNTDRKVVEIKEANVEITYADKGRIEISNNSSVELDLSYWRIKYKDIFFVLPKGTFILEKSRGIFPASATNIVVDNLKEVSLLYPNGIVANTFLVPVDFLPIVNKKLEEKTKPIERVEYIYVPVVEEIAEEKITEKDEFSSSTQLATALSQVSIEKESASGIYKWLLGLIVIVSIGSLLLLSRDRGSSGKEVTAKDIKIVT